MQIFQPSDITPTLLSDGSTKNSFVANTSGKHSFGNFPVNNHGSPVANIYLKLGYVGYGSVRSGAFGLRHIWEKHGAELSLSDPIDAIKFIESILQVGAHVILDQTKGNKPVVVQSSAGLVTLGLTKPPNEDPYFNIITAYDRRNHPGTLIAKL